MERESHLKRKDLLIAIIILAAAGALFILSRGNLFNTALLSRGATATISADIDAPNGSAIQTPSESSAGVVSPDATLVPSESYLLITVGDVVFEPYPLLEERDVPITQVDGKQNVVHISVNGFFMLSATCSNQECVHQGEVTLENRDQRILFNQVVCLPNQVMLELLTPEEAAVVWENTHAQKK